ncbi:hypothetical protein [Pseudomonas sp. Marseille-QA0892]
MSQAQRAFVFQSLTNEVGPSPAGAAPLRRDVWIEPDTARAIFHVEADAESESLARILNLFSLQLLLPDAFLARREADRLYVHIEQAAISGHRAEVIGQKLRSLFCVLAVDLIVIC